jgi:hypothetical protein
VGRRERLTRCFAGVLETGSSLQAFHGTVAPETVSREALTLFVEDDSTATTPCQAVTMKLPAVGPRIRVTLDLSEHGTRDAHNRQHTHQGPEAQP